MKKHLDILITLTLLLLVGCQPVDNLLTNEPPPPTAPTGEARTDTITPTMSPNTKEPAAQQLVSKAKILLAQKLGMVEEEIFLFDVKAVEWPDASLGCPQAGVMYAQVITPGYQILLEAKGQVFTFHTDETSQVILCNARGPDEIYLPP